MESNGYEPRDRSLVGLLATLTHGVLSRPDATEESVTAHTAPTHRSLLDRLDNWFADQELKSREAFLAQAVDIVDLEQRLRWLERGH
jgi:hypothetical protein